MYIMSYLSLTNEVLNRLNEVELTESNFDEAMGFQKAVKGHVNTAIRRINQQQYEWPFNHVQVRQDLCPGVQLYDLPFDCKTVDWESFYILPGEKEGAVRLRQLRYDEWMSLYRSSDEAALRDGTGGKPSRVFRTQSMQFGVTPPPDAAYTVSYEYWRVPGDMIYAEDVTTIPEQFRWVIIEGALAESYKFRDNVEMSSMADAAFQQGLKDMRKLLVNHYDYVQGTAILGRY